MEISIEQVKKLRNKTGAGLLDCKSALNEAEGDFEKAIEILRKKGSASSAKRIDRIANEGMILAKTNDNRNEAALIEFNCETDFVARSKEFIGFTQKVIESILKSNKTEIQDLMKEEYTSGIFIKQAFDELSGKIGEKIEIKRIEYLKSDVGFFCVYNHVGNKVASVVEISGEITADGISLGNDLAMQVVAMKPLVIDRTQFSKEMLEKERDIYYIQAKNEEKPDNIAQKIADNKIEKYFQENCLVDQEFIKEPGKTVGDIINSVSKQSGKNYIVIKIIRFQLGETIN